MKAEDAIERMRGIRRGFKNTLLPRPASIALAEGACAEKQYLPKFPHSAFSRQKNALILQNVVCLSDKVQETMYTESITGNLCAIITQLRQCRDAPCAAGLDGRTFMDIDMDIKELEAFVYVVENCSFFPPRSCRDLTPRPSAPHVSALERN